MSSVPPKPFVLRHAALAAAFASLATVASFASLACNNRQSIVVPNRVLDRPTDMVMACLRRDTTTDIISPTSLDQCINATCGDLRLVGFIANSEHAVAHVVPVLEHYANVSPERVWLAGGRIGVTYLLRRTSSFARQIAAERCEGPRIGCRWRGQ